ncbi:MAG: tripartite tricarboxylate transporter substrate binding protein [Rhizobacter sp.]
MRALVAVSLALASGMAQAQWNDCPARQIRLVIGYTPGGAADAIARIVGDAMAKQLGVGIVVDNKPGAGSTLASDILARAAPDGCTLGLATGTLYGIDQYLYKAKYTPQDFTAITRLTTSPLILAVNKGLGADSIAGLKEKARAAAGGLNYASSGIGGSPHMAALMFEKSIGAGMTHIPYKGGAPALQAVAQGDVHFSFGTASSVLPLGHQGMVRMIGISSLTRSAIAPEIPTLAELGLPGFEFTFWFGLFGPAKLPKEMVEKLHTAAVKAANQPEVKAKLLSSGNEVSTSATPEAFNSWASEDGRRVRERAEQAKVKID